MYVKADESAAKQDTIDETILDDGAAHESTAAVTVDDAVSQIAVHENGTGSVAEITPNQDPAKIATAVSVAAEVEPQPAAANDSATQTKAVQEDDATSAAKRAIIHEWENWSALHSDELDDPNVAEYFFRHLKMRRPYLSTLGSQETWSIVRG